MNKNGFVFVETIVAIVVLTSALLLLYSSFNNVLQSEKTRVDYDDIAYIYRTQYLKNTLDDLNIKPILVELESNQNKYFTTIGTDTNNLFSSEEKKVYFNKLLTDYEVKQMIILKENKIDNLKNCNLNCTNDNKCNETENCNSLYMEISEEMLAYLKTIYVDFNCQYILAVEYETCQNNSNCKHLYSWVSV